MQITPAILALDEDAFLTFAEKLRESNFSTENFIHIDFMDGKFVETNNSRAGILNYKNWIKIRDYKTEAHLMIKDPGILEYLDCGFNRILLHAESSKVDESDFEMIHSEGAEGGLVINPETNIEDVKNLLGKIDVLQIMGVHPGKQGQEFIPGVLKKIELAVKMRLEMGLNFLIGVDGGVNIDNVKLIKDAGADYVVVGSAIFEGDIEKNVQRLNQQIN